MIYHITTFADWTSAQSAGRYRAPSLDQEGFIHCSTAAQVVPVANRYYRGAVDLCLLSIAEDRLSAPLKWEPPAPPSGSPSGPRRTPDQAAAAAAELYPHLYGPLNLDAVLAITALHPSPSGDYTFPQAQ